MHLLTQCYQARIPSIRDLLKHKFFFLLLTCIIIFFFRIFIYKKTYLVSLKYIRKLKIKPLNPLYLFITLFLILGLTVTPTGSKVGEDISSQVLSTKHFIENKIEFPNLILKPSPDDLSIDHNQWHIRPPGASWFTLPGLVLGLSLGHAIILSLATISLAGGIGWLQLAKKLGVQRLGQLYLSMLLSLSLGLNINYLGTMNCCLFALVPWLIIFAIHISQFNLKNNICCYKNIFLAALFFIILGFFSILKLSGMIAALTISCIPFLIILFNKDWDKKKFLVISLFILSFLLFAPYKTFEYFNDLNHQISSDSMYSSIDYNKQTPLWGHSFSESTRGSLLILSAIGSPGYALTLKSLNHSIRDFLLQFRPFTNWSKNKKINPHAFVCGILGTIIFSTACIIIYLNWSLFNNIFILIICTFYIIPFIGLAIVSNFHGFNYSLYSSHTYEYSIILIFPLIIVWESLKRNHFIQNSLLGLLLLFPFYEILRSAEPFSYNKFRSRTEINNGMSSSRFSEGINAIEDDSSDCLDIIFFLPAGDSGDLQLRTNMRTIRFHFSGDNFPNAKEYISSKKISVYCAYDASLENNLHFKRALDLKFPQKSTSKTIHSGEVIVERFSLVPKS